MDNEKFKPVRHDHKEFLSRAAIRAGFTEAYDALEAEYRLIYEMLEAPLGWTDTVTPSPP